MKETKAATLEPQCCPLCGCDEYLISDSGSMLCAGCGSFFENVHQILSCGISHAKRIEPIFIQTSSLMN